MKAIRRFLIQYRCSRCGRYVAPIVGGTTDHLNNSWRSCHWRCFTKDVKRGA